MTFVVEFVGLPGAGKTTIGRLVRLSLRSGGEFVAAPPATSVAVKLRAALRYRHALGVAVAALTRSSRSFLDKLFAFRLIVVTFGQHDLTRRRRVHSIFLLDEGVVQRLFLLFVDASGVSSSAVADVFLGAAPLPDLIVMVKIRPEVAVVRLSGRSRGIPDRFAALSFEMQVARFREAQAMLASSLDSLGIDVVTVDGEEGEDALAAQIAEQIKRRLMCPTSGAP